VHAAPLAGEIELGLAVISLSTDGQLGIWTLALWIKHKLVVALDKP
jgi:hypothetical protein